MSEVQDAPHDRALDRDIASELRPAGPPRLEESSKNAPPQLQPRTPTLLQLLAGLLGVAGLLAALLARALLGVAATLLQLAFSSARLLLRLAAGLARLAGWLLVQLAPLLLWGALKYVTWVLEGWARQFDRAMRWLHWPLRLWAAAKGSEGPGGQPAAGRVLAARLAVLAALLLLLAACGWLGALERAARWGSWVLRLLPAARGVREA